MTAALTEALARGRAETVIHAILDGRAEPDADHDWTARALCAQTDPDLFYPDKGERVDAAIAICAACPVKAQCLDYALANDERFGVWGGKSERQRHALAKQRKADIDPRPTTPTERATGIVGGEDQ